MVNVVMVLDDARTITWQSETWLVAAEEVTALLMEAQQGNPRRRGLSSRSPVYIGGTELELVKYTAGEIAAQMIGG